MKKEHKKIIVIILGLIIISLLGYAVILTYFNEDKTTKYSLDNKMEVSSKVKNILQIILIIFVVILVFLGLIEGYKQLYEDEEKIYLKYEGTEKNEYKFRYGDQDFYIRKEDIKDGNHY